MASRTQAIPARDTLRRLRSLLDEAPYLIPKFSKAKSIVRAFRRPAFYEVSERCNLFCEGCFYFEGPSLVRSHQSADIESWRAFFERESNERKVSMAYFAGAEPALEQERLFAAKDFFPYSNVGTNGTIKIDPAIPFRIAVSVWGDAETDTKLRGANVFRKALANYGEDPRVLVYFTLSAWNLGSAREVVIMCKDHGLPLTFNMYSPTSPYLNKVQDGVQNDKAYFRLAKKGNTPCFDDETLLACRKTVRDLMQEFPETIIYTEAYNNWATRLGSMFNVDDASGLAENCGSRIIGNLKYYGTDLQNRELKCPTPDIDCRDCRMYSAGWSTRLQIRPEDVTSLKAVETWCNDIAILGKIFLYPPAEPASNPQDYRQVVEPDPTLSAVI